MESRLRIVLVDPEKGDAKVAYLGGDAGRADKAFEKACADETNECVRYFIYPMPAKQRKPAEEKASAAQHQKAATEHLGKVAERKVNEAAARVKTAEAALEAAKQAHAELVPEQAEPVSKKEK